MSNLNYAPYPTYIEESEMIISNNFVQQQTAEFLAWLQREVMDILPELKHGRAYPLRTLCGEDIWLQMDRRQRRMAGQFLEQLVASQYSDLRFAYAEYGSPKLYQLKKHALQSATATMNCIAFAGQNLE